jgi:hypothetical protein
MSKPLFKSELPVQGLVTITQTAVSCGVGLLLASKLQRNAQRNTAWAMLTVGALSTLPLVYDLISRKVAGPKTERGMRRTLESIREDSGFADDAEIV